MTFGKCRINISRLVQPGISGEDSIFLEDEATLGSACRCPSIWLEGKAKEKGKQEEEEQIARKGGKKNLGVDNINGHGFPTGNYKNIFLKSSQYPQRRRVISLQLYGLQQSPIVSVMAAGMTRRSSNKVSTPGDKPSKHRACSPGLTNKCLSAHFQFSKASLHGKPTQGVGHPRARGNQRSCWLHVSFSLQL